MSSPFKEAHQVQGVYPDPANLEMANRLMSQPTRSQAESEMVARLRERPPFTGDVSMYFKDGTSFDMQEDQTGRQYMVLPRPNPSVLHPQVDVGSWICQMPDGRFIALSDTDYKAFGGEPEDPNNIGGRKRPW